MKKTKELKKNQKGVTMISLIVVILLLVVIAAVTVSTSLDRFEINKIQKMYNDIKLLSEKVSNYYLKYNGLPVLRDAREEKIEYNYTQITFETNVNDSDVYYIIDLEAMDGIAINYGKEGFENPNTTDDVYIINEASHSIYYVKGVEVDGETYHTIPGDNLEFEDITNSTKPQIKIVSGEKATLGQYLSPIKIEIIPGKNNVSNIERTTVIINSDNELDISELENNMITIEDDGIYTITAKSYTNGGNVASTSIVVDKTNHSDVLIPTIDAVGVFANNANIKEVREGNVPIPTGFQYVKGDKIGGVVITDAASSTATDGNEFVWIPVEHINDMVMCQEHPTETLNETTLECPTCGANTKLAGKLYATEIGTPSNVDTANTTFEENIGFREPDVVTCASGSDSTAGSERDASNLSELGITSDLNNDNVVNAKDLKVYFQNTFNSMAKSVAKYKGFYVGKYEMSISGNGIAQSKTGTGENIITPFTENWYKTYTSAKTYQMRSITSEMIWGCQYDAMMRWMSSNSITVTSSRPVTGAKKNKNKMATGTEKNDKLNNIYDLLGCNYEWTQEAASNKRRNIRGGCYNYEVAPSYRVSDGPIYNGDKTTTRMSFYIEV